jgi:branched-chain amino acid transport system permease protein
MVAAALAARAIRSPPSSCVPGQGGAVLLKAWVGAVLGGFGSIPGAVVGGIVVGVLDAFTAAFISSNFRDAITMLVLVGFLVFRPQGIFGERVAEKL